MRIHQLTKNETIKIATKQSVNFSKLWQASGLSKI